MRNRNGKKSTHKANGAVLFALVEANGEATDFEVEVDGVVVGVIGSYLGNVDKKRTGSRVVASRRQATLWSVKPANGGPIFGYRNRTDALTTLVATAR